jgi:hypothetical protein
MFRDRTSWRSNSCGTMEILDASYEKANPHAIASKCTCLSPEERSALLKLLLRCEDPFDGTLGTWNGPEI